MNILQQKEQLISLGQGFVKSFHRIYATAVDYNIELGGWVRHHTANMQELYDRAVSIISACQDSLDKQELERAFFTAGGLASIRLKTPPERWVYHRFCCDIKRSFSAPIKTHLVNNNLVDR